MFIYSMMCEHVKLLWAELEWKPFSVHTSYSTLQCYLGFHFVRHRNCQISFFILTSLQWFSNGYDVDKFNDDSWNSHFQNREFVHEPVYAQIPELVVWLFRLWEDLCENQKHNFRSDSFFNYFMSY